jgi:ABC-type phosphate/phosphonate transport system ATPase subunit
VIEQLVNYAAENGITLIMVTHSLIISQKYCTKIIKIKDGEIAG